MSTSDARIAANRLNALRSTGPRTAEGKAVSRLNAIRHGMAGEGDLPGPGENLALITDRSTAFARELGANCDLTLFLARRVALLSVRLENSAIQEMSASAASTAQAKANFDQELADEVEEWVLALEGETPSRAIAALEASPAGLARLILIWTEMRGALLSDDSFESILTNRTVAWLGLTEDEADELSTADLAKRIDAELRRLRAATASMAAMAQAIDQARTQAGIIASFDPSPAANLARRYEAAAERGMYRAIRAIAEINRATGADQTQVQPQPEVIRRLPTIPPEATLPSLPRPAAALGSFRADVPPAPPSRPEPRKPIESSSISEVERRKKRPDLRKLALAHR